ncbi:MAG: AsmA family protein [Verrucomicrobiota bacterium]|jgi:hypothetical protein
MADATVSCPAPGKRRGWLRLLAWILGSLAALVIIAYLIATSSAFFKGVILPRVGKALNADITVSDASISPFHQVVLRHLKVQAIGAEPLVTVPEIRLRYSLMDIIAGNIHVELVASDPSFPEKPPEATLRLDAGLHAKVLDLRQCQLDLAPTERAANRVQLTGKVDLTDGQATRGNLKLVADSLDLTRYYDLFVGQNAPSAANRPKVPPPAKRAGSGPEEEPGPKKLPFRNFSAEVAIRRLYLREIELADWQTTTKIDGGHVVVKPLKLTLNGAPVETTLDMNLNVAGFKYNLALDAQAVPLAPLVNTFQPQWKGILSGTLTAQAKVEGAGMTGAGFKKNLTGQFDLTSTNLDLSVDKIPGDKVSMRLLKTLIAAITLIPDLTRNLAGAGGSLIHGLTGHGGGRTAGPGGPAGLTAELKESPINSIVLHGTAGSGKIDLRQVLIQGPAFEALAGGTITLQDVLTNSTLQIPVSVYLERGVARRLKMADNAPANGAYAKLPDFLTMKGTLGNPKSHIDKTALAGAVLEGLGREAAQAGGGLFQGLGGRPGNRRPATNAPAASASAPATNQSPAGNLPDNLFGPKK